MSRNEIQKLKAKYGELFRAASFGIAGAVGFLVVEAILTLGVYFIYGSFVVPSDAFSSPDLISLNVLAFAIGVTVSFFINEKITVSNDGEQRTKRGNRNVIKRLLKFQGVYFVGNVITIVTQLILLRAVGLAPSLGNIIGAIIAFPVSYFFSMRYVWSIRTLAPSAPVQSQENKTEDNVSHFENSIDEISKQMNAIFGRREVIVNEYRFEVTQFENAEGRGIKADFALKLHVSNKVEESPSGERESRLTRVLNIPKN